jgi:class 3 adenylate cyclase
LSTADRVERRLTAILAADVAGYSRLMGADEEGTLAQLKAHRRALLDPKIAEHRGRLVKTTGDGMLVEFASVVDALRCAVEVQRGMAERNAEVPQEKRIEFRVGIHQGDIMIDGDDIFGDGVNVAARLEGLAEPGGICVSGRVQEDAEGRLEITFEDVGEQQLKNIARAVRVYRVRLSGAATSSRPALPLPDKPLDCRASVREYQRRPRAGVFRGWHRGGDNHGAIALSTTVRHQFQLPTHHRREASWSRAGCALRARRERAEGGEPSSHHWSAP